jgi:hypothetical protein
MGAGFKLSLMKVSFWHWLTLTKAGHTLIGITGGLLLAAGVVLAISGWLVPAWSENPEGARDLFLNVLCFGGYFFLILSSVLFFRVGRLAEFRRRRSSLANHSH